MNNELLEYIETFVLVLILGRGGGGKSSNTHTIATGINRGEAAFNAGERLRKAKLGRKQFIANYIKNNVLTDEQTAKAEAIKIHDSQVKAAKTSLVAALKKPPKNSIYRPLAIDLDRQASLTHVYGLEKNTLPTLFDVLRGDVTIFEAIVQTPHGFILPGGRNLDYLEQTGSDYLAVAKSLRLLILKDLSRLFFPIVIDTAPSQNHISNDIALAAADGVIISAVGEEFAKEGVIDSLDKIERIKDLNPNLETLGILMNRYEEDTVNKVTINEIREVSKKYDVEIFNSYIRECTVVKKAQKVKQSIFDYDEVGETTTADYLTFFNELLNKNERLKCPKIKN